MDSNLQSELANLFAAYRARKFEEESAENKRVDQRNQFVAHFATRCAHDYTSALENFAVELELYDVTARCEFDSGGTDEHGDFQRPWFAMLIEFGDSASNPALVLSCDADKQEVNVKRASLAKVDGCLENVVDNGNVKLSQLTEDFLHRHLMELMRGLLTA